MFLIFGGDFCSFSLSFLFGSLFSFIIPSAFSLFASTKEKSELQLSHRLILLMLNYGSARGDIRTFASDNEGMSNRKKLMSFKDRGGNCQHQPTLSRIEAIPTLDLL